MPQIPNDTRWNTHEACVDTFLKNFHKYMEINTEQEIDGKIATTLNNVGLYREALHLQKQLKEVAIALDKLQSDSATLPTAVETCIQLLQSEDLKPYRTQIKKRMTDAVEPFFYVAYFMDPQYMENAALETENISKSEGDEITNAKTEESSEAAKSLKCDECGKLFKNSEEVEFHAVKSGHSSFSESTEEKKPLTEEERKQKVKDLEEKLKQRRREKEEEERKEAVEREKKRIQMSRNIAETKRRIQEEEMKRIADERRREKLEDKMARQRVREQIERDKEARKEMFGGGTKTNSAPSVSQPPQPVLTPAQKKEYDCTRLQIRLPSGSPLVQEFKSKESLSAVRLWVGINRKDKECTSQSFKLSTTFPRKIFDEEDMDKPLSVLGLVPSAVLVVTDN